MIVIKLHGGLGNQLFQYAFGRAMAHRLDTELRFDVSFFAHHSQRSYGLSMFQAEAREATLSDVEQVCGNFGRWYFSPNLYAQRFRRHLGKYHILPHYVSETGFDATFRPQNQSFYEGYWQNPHYFEAIETLLRHDLRFQTALNDHSQPLLNHIENTNSVCLHVRRGDYLHLERYVVLPVFYYQNALKYLQKSEVNLTIFVFSDDVAWCKKNLNLQVATVFVENVVNLRDEFELMCRCKHHLIANSTLSWWAAWLCSNPTKTVIAPQKWFNDHTNIQSLLPSGWIQIPN